MSLTILVSRDAYIWRWSEGSECFKLYFEVSSHITPTSSLQLGHRESTMLWWYPTAFHFERPRHYSVHVYLIEYECLRLRDRNYSVHVYLMSTSRSSSLHHYELITVGIFHIVTVCLHWISIEWRKWTLLIKTNAVLSMWTHLDLYTRHSLQSQILHNIQDVNLSRFGCIVE